MGKYSQKLKPKLKVKHKIFAEWRVAGDSQAKAAAKAGYPLEHCRRNGSAIEKRPEVQEYMADLREGLIEESLKKTAVGRKILKAHKLLDDGRRMQETFATRLLCDDLHVVFGDRGAVVNWDEEGNVEVTASRSLSKRNRRLIEKIETERVQTDDGSITLKTKVHLESRDKAKDRLLKFFGPQNKSAVLELLSSGSKGTSHDDDESGERTTVIIKVPSNGRVYAKKDEEEKA